MNELNKATMPVAKDPSVREPTALEVSELHDHIAPYVNKFTVAVMKNDMVKLGLSIEYTPEQNRFVTSVNCNIRDIASLHNLLTKLLTSYQQQQQAMIQAAQGKVNPSYLETLKGMQEANKET